MSNEYVVGRKEERASIVRWLRSLTTVQGPQLLADEIDATGAAEDREREMDNAQD